MNKKLILTALLAVMTVAAQAQWFDFSNNNRRLGIGFQLGPSAVGTQYSDFSLGASMNLLGVHIDFLSIRPEHQYDNHVTDTYYADSASYTINLGYQIPVLPWLRLMPIVGYCQTNHGRTDASTVNIENTDEYSSQMYHDYNVHPGSRRHYFNYGIGLSVQPIKWVDIYAVASRRAIYGGISLNLGAFADED